MPNLVQVLKQEVSRLARKDIKMVTTKLRDVGKRSGRQGIKKNTGRNNKKEKP